MGMRFNDVGNDRKNLMFISKSSGVNDAELNNVIQIIDEKGNEMNFTLDKFIEIYDNHGLAGFVM